MIELRRAGVKAAYTRLNAAILKGLAPEMILDEISLWIGRGESFAIFGDRYAGKAALMRLLAGHIPADAGEIVIKGRTVASIDGYDGLIDGETGEKNARLLLKDEAMVREAERLFQDRALLSSPVIDYSRCERARLSMAIALASKPDVLVVSKQLEQLERPFMEQYSIEIRTMTLSGMTLIMDCADMERLSRLCESAIWLKAGRLYRIGSFEEIALNFRRSGIRELGRVAFSKELVPNTERKKSKGSLLRRILGRAHRS